jgi:hypothetical protein
MFLILIQVQTLEWTLQILQIYKLSAYELQVWGVSLGK